MNPSRTHLFIGSLLALAAVLGISAPAYGQADESFAVDTIGPGERRPDFTLRLGGYAFDPAAGEPPLDSGWDRSRSDRPDLHLVQLHGRTRAGWLETIRARGLQVVQYIYPHTYVLWGRADERQTLERQEFVRWSGDFAPAFRVQPRWRNLDPRLEQVRVLIYRGAGTDDVVQRIERAGGQLRNRRVLDGKFELAGFELAGDRVQAVASIPGVYSVRLRPTDGGLRTEMSDQVNVNNVDGTNLAFPGYLAWLTGVGLDGSGVIMANVDGGIEDTHPDLINRMLPCTGSTCGGAATDDHGTHTAGIMAGDGNSGTLDSFGFLRGLGVAPGANLVEQLYSPTFTQPGGMLTLITDSYRNNAVLSGNSWGPSGSPQGYDDDTMQVDIGVRDADADAPGNQPFTYVLSFMNGNGGTSSQGTPDEAKNLFNIGSTKMQNSSGTQILDEHDLSSNSAHGPALDGRTIPHMVAPGCYVDSTDIPTTYGLKCGTSMASPHVAGAIALFIEYYRGLPDYTVDPSPALVKAAFLPVAKDLAGFNDADGGTLGHPFDSKQGWGRMDLEAVVDPVPNSVRYFDNPVLFDNTGEEWVRTLSPLDPAEPVRLMLVWTDAPGHGLGGSTPAWNNDLDLQVEVGADVFLGNQFGTDGLSVTGGSADFMNNTEGVFLASAPGGFTVRVKATDINSDGVPSVGDDTDQDFALVCYNCALEPGFTLSADPTAIEVCAPGSAFYDLDVGSILGFADPVSLIASGIPAGATATFTVDPVTPAGTSTLQITDTDLAASGDYAIMVEGTAAGVDRTVELALRIDAGLPVGPVLTAPADGASGVSTAPIVEWSAVAEASGYELEVASDAAFANLVYQTVENGTQHMVDAMLEVVTTYYWRVRALNTCGVGPWSPVFSLTTLDVPPVLLVDDDDNGPDVSQSYTDALDALGVAYDVWDTSNSDDEPTANDLAPYETVIWFTGDEFGGVSGPGSAAEADLIQWLDASHCLLIASQDYYYDRGATGFMQTQLGLDTAQSDQGQTTAAGQGSVFAGLGPYTLSFPYTNYTDILTPDVTAETAFDGSAGSLAIAKDTLLYRTSFWGFGLEALPTAADQQTVLSTFLTWCEDLAQQDPDTDGTVNGDDCAPADATLWSKPDPATGLFVTAAGAFDWTPPASPGSTTATYDLLRSDAGSDFGLATCIVTDSATPNATDVDTPAVGDGFYYLIRVRNGCGETLGVDSAGEERPNWSCL